MMGGRSGQCCDRADTRKGGCLSIGRRRIERGGAGVEGRGGGGRGVERVGTCRIEDKARFRVSSVTYGSCIMYVELITHHFRPAKFFFF